MKKYFNADMVVSWSLFSLYVLVGSAMLWFCHSVNICKGVIRSLWWLWRILLSTESKDETAKMSSLEIALRKRTNKIKAWLGKFLCSLVFAPLLIFCGQIRLRDFADHLIISVVLIPRILLFGSTILQTKIGSSFCTFPGSIYIYAGWIFGKNGYSFFFWST